MELHIGGPYTLPVAAVAATQSHFYSIAQVLFGWMARVGLSDRLALDQAAHSVNIKDGCDTGDCHGHAAVGLMLEQAFLGQYAEDFAQGIARNLQVFA
ncbi:hypothetical protein X945_6036 [Burkholderia pseudomallei ABCPW 107]|nr:hypothetical protein X945_6036 [Burkholderia pseudomallei ABCPW 107]